MNETIEKFGYPETLLREFEHWVILLRPAQPTLGSIVLAAKSSATEFSALPPEAHAELALITKKIEAALKDFVGYSRINYLMLMMVDPNVHFHVIPRYEGVREFDNKKFVDAGWPRLPELGQAVSLEANEIEAMVKVLRPLLASAAGGQA